MTLAVFENAHFILRHAEDCFIPGYLILFPKKSVLSIADFDAETQTHLGQTLTLAHQVINKIIQPERIYTMVFAEILRTVHFHLFPRTHALKQEYLTKNSIAEENLNGALLFDWARKFYRSESSDNYQALIAKINQEFSQLN